jgi:hypothetical protein
VQRVSEECWGVVEKLANNGGWDQDLLKPPKVAEKSRPKEAKRKTARDAAEDGGNRKVRNKPNSEGQTPSVKSSAARKRKAGEIIEKESVGRTGRSSRPRRSS